MAGAGFEVAIVPGPQGQSPINVKRVEKTEEEEEDECQEHHRVAQTALKVHAESTEPTPLPKTCTCRGKLDFLLTRAGRLSVGWLVTQQTRVELDWISGYRSI